MQIDIHSHSVQRPLGKSYDKKVTVSNSVWYKTKLHFFTKWLTRYLTFAKFTQSDFTSQVSGNTRVLFLSLYPIEKEFFIFKYPVLNVLGINVWLANLVTSLGTKRIKAIQNRNSYFEGFKEEFQFIKDQEGKKYSVNGLEWEYRIISRADAVSIPDLMDITKRILYIVPTVEGMHILDQAMENKTTGLEALIEEIKKNYPIFFAGLAHHFWNGLCGHAPSLNSGFSKYFLDQSLHCNEGMKPEGYQVVDALLRTDNGNRIHIDVKHMSVAARIDYYHYLDTKYAGQPIPVIVSHGSCNGLEKLGKKYITYGMDKTAMIMKNEPLNIYDEELIRIAKSKGIMGLQLDKKRLLHPDFMPPADSSFLIWNQIEHIAVLLDRNYLNCWDCIAIGSDNDGIVNPVNPYWTASELPSLKEAVKSHLQYFLQHYFFLVPANKLDADQILHKIFFENAWQFMQRYW